jgi:predicted nucleotidyltransferase
MPTNVLAAHLRRHLPTILEDLPVQVAYLHGSAVRGGMTASSDVDIALLATQELPPQERLRLMLDLSLELEERCDLREADVRIIDDAPLVLQGRVVTEGILLYSRDEAERVRYETATRMRYFDYLPIHQQLRDAFLANVREQGLYYGRSGSD